MRSTHTQSIGHLGESIASAFLISRGYSIIGQNVRTPYGEIDLIARQANEIIFVEIKTRASKSLGPPEISITPLKQEHMKSSAEYYIQQHPDLATDWRIDLITIQLSKDSNPPIIDHFENVI